ncbi:GNAT family N-acetyltransferase [Promicromonospora sukumoe]|jgi:L-amino acid N-acyltransferase YncA|uniref:Phosphinothricin acetyltransferase n=1 Tax=Promicromonospora sukumoe TaxID=88382 RepID=A0A7W3JB81_9MICO|nr:GNAT family N-acetyltransferase [Promicromonospora sukumoe]MBA8809574.1 phosphinothricin acetyltransferase [Promicromonospora sukumoe]
MDSIVRVATPDDAAACAAIYAPFVADSAATFETRPPDAREMTRRIERFFGRETWLVLESHGTVVGFAYAKPFADRPTFRWTLETNVYVATEHQRVGGGRALYEALLTRLARRGYHRVVASIVLPNDPAIALHEAVGFQRAGSFEKIGWKLGAWRDAVMFQRDLVADDGLAPGNRTADAELQGLLTPEPLEVTRTPLLRPHPAEDQVAYFGD